MQEPNNKVSLGCGTLILIALIVMIFSNSGNDNEAGLRQQLQELQADVKRLEPKVNTALDIGELKAESKKQTATLKQIQQTLEALAPKSTPEAPLPEN